MDTNKMREAVREQFEAWVLRGWPDQSLARFTTGEYQGFTVEHCWQAWKASREAVVVAMPEPCEYADPQSEYAKGHRIGKRDVVTAIEAQGLKVRS